MPCFILEHNQKIKKMAKIIQDPSVIPSVGTKPKKIEEFVGGVNTASSDVSIARMTSPQGWKEPGQTPEFDEYTYVISGKIKVETKTGDFTANAGDMILAKKDQWVRYSTPFEGGAHYLAICLPAFTPDSVNRDED